MKMYSAELDPESSWYSRLILWVKSADVVAKSMGSYRMAVIISIMLVDIDVQP